MQPLHSSYTHHPPLTTITPTTTQTAPGGHITNQPPNQPNSEFQRGEATKNLLRTHTTAVSARMLYQLANQPGGFTPQKLFSIDRVFRNESMDATHLCEFHQVRGGWVGGWVGG
jgi:phenylalanyl-tRNA synthetase alpha subunit